MTNTYHIQARCLRPFDSWIEIDADTPEDALAKARLEGSELAAAAEDGECWPWDDFSVHDHRGNTLLHVFDDKARLREAAAALLAALTACTNYMADDLDESDETESRIFRQACAAIVEAGTVPPLPVNAAAGRPFVTVSIRGGLIEDLESTIPVTVVVEDWDVPDEDAGKKPTRSVQSLTGGLLGPRVDKLRRLIVNA